MIRAASRSQRFECRDAASDEDRDRQDVGRGEARLHQETAERGANLSDPIGVNEVALTQRDYSAFDSEQIDDLEMLPRLWTKTLVTGHIPKAKLCRSLTLGDMPSRGRS